MAGNLDTDKRESDWIKVNQTFECRIGNGGAAKSENGSSVNFNSLGTDFTIMSTFSDKMKSDYQIFRLSDSQIGNQWVTEEFGVVSGIFNTKGTKGGEGERGEDFNRGLRGQRGWVEFATARFPLAREFGVVSTVSDKRIGSGRGSQVWMLTSSRKMGIR